MKKADKLKRQRYEISMKIIELESKLRVSKLQKNQEKELDFLKKREEELTRKIDDVR